MSNASSVPDVNERFAAERRAQLTQAAGRQVDLDRRVADGRLVPLGGGRYRVNDPGSWDDGEVWTLTDGQVRPQAGLDVTTGQPALYTAVPAWHQLGTVIPGGSFTSFASCVFIWPIAVPRSFPSRRPVMETVCRRFSRLISLWPFSYSISAT